MENNINLKKSQHFDTDPKEAVPTLRGAQHFDDQELHFIPQASALNANSDDEIDHAINAQINSAQSQVKRKKNVSLLAKLMLIGLGLLLVTETLLGLNRAWITSPWLFGLYASVLSVFVLWAVGISISEWRKLTTFKSVIESQQTGDRLSQSLQSGEADKFINNIIAKLPNDLPLEDYLSSIKDEHNDAEKLILFDELVLSASDAKAKKLVWRFAQESALLLAASPLAALDMAIILWRNQGMIYGIAQCYGIELGYLSRLKLIRGIITNIIYAGASEIAADLGTQLLTVEVTGKLSARLGQGLGGGLLTARLGYQAMALCRPISCKEASRPKLSGIHKELLVALQGFSSKMMTKTGVRKKDFTTND
ncbi:TIGR01620 family protein [Shewanella sp. VB17]|uniref:TIGR01620 family protein n=1 Tax=Shewanella sp. VB17 TaxID=2739432 RepID=UPI0015639A97|nr:TIGR01620 family protein [Shewanella sp. VB17]NRD73468.1 TIGR01620 family protein [Shewanella sp. VB17]